MDSNRSKIEKLISGFCPDGVEFKNIGEIGKLYNGLSGKSKADFTNGNAKFISYMNVYSNPSVNTQIDDTVNIAPSEKQNIVEYGDVLFTGSS